VLEENITGRLGRVESATLCYWGGKLGLGRFIGVSVVFRVRVLGFTVCDDGGGGRVDGELIMCSEETG